jgi:hypothetical protein
MTNAQIQDQLEMLLDKSSVAAILEVLSNICAEKADHIQTNWQDGGLATEWREMSDKLQNVFDI